MSLVLNITIPVVILAYAVYLIVRMVKQRRRCGHWGGCAGCPYAHGCAQSEEDKKPDEH